MGQFGFGTASDNLTLASPEVNRSQKSNRDAAAWSPPLAANRCWFAARVTLVRDRYNLTIDREERDTLEEILMSCKNTTMVVTPGAETSNLIESGSRLTHPVGSPQLAAPRGDGRGPTVGSKLSVRFRST